MTPRSNKKNSPPPPAPPAEAVSEAEQILEAIRAGEVDAFVVSAGGQEEVWTVDGAHMSYLALLDLVKEGAVTLTPKGGVLHAGRRISNMLTGDAEIHTGRGFDEFVAPSERPRFLKFLEQAVEGEALAEFELQTSEGVAIPARLKGRGFQIHEGQCGVGIVIGDLREEMFLEKLRTSEERYRYAAKAANEVIWELEIDSGAMHISPAMEEIFGWTDPVNDIGWWNARIHPEDRERMERGLQEALAQGAERWESHCLFERADGSYAQVFNRAYILRREDGTATKVIGAMLDQSERHRYEQELRDVNDQLEQRVEESTRSIQSRSTQLRKLANEQTKAVHEERKRIADLLHNDVQQLLVSILMRLDAANHSSKDEKTSKLVTTAYDLASQAIGKTRLLTSELYPPILQHGTLNEIIAWIAADMKSKHELEVALELSEAISTLPDEFKYILFESVRELLFNVVKHAGTRRAAIRLDRNDGMLFIRVGDEGQGSETDAGEARGGGGNGDHFGLFSIRERVENYGGTIAVRTAPKAGFEVEISLPIDAAKENPMEQSDPALAAARGRREAAVAAKNRTVRVMIVDDHQLVREGIATILQAQPNLQIVGEASDGHEAVELARRLQPELILMDINLPTMTGIQATRIISEEFPGIKVIGLSVNHDEPTMRSIMDAGASAYVEKASCAKDLIKTINSISGL